MPYSPTRQIIDQQRVIETEAAELVKKLRVEIAKLSQQMAVVSDEAFAIFLKETINRLRKILEVNEALLEKNAVAITAEIAGITKKAAAAAFVKQRAPKLIKGALTSITLSTISNEMKRLHGQKFSNEAIRKAVIGNRRQRYVDGLLGKLQTDTETFSRTESKATIETAKDKKRRDTKDIIGYVWVSVLDNRTSTICQDLAGKRFYYNRSGAKPMPPIHPNCRSSTEPLYKDKPIPDTESFKDWAKNPANREELKEALGLTRYALYTTGKIKIERFNNVFFEPLTLKEMRLYNEIGFERIGQ